jgi:hypothetical protein
LSGIVGRTRELMMKGILLYGIPIVIAVLLHKFGFRTDAGSAGKGEPKVGNGNTDGDGDTARGSTYT